MVLDKSFIPWSSCEVFHIIMESNDRKNVYLTKTGDNSLNSGMRDTMIVGQANMAPGNALKFLLKIYLCKI